MNEKVALCVAAAARFQQAFEDAWHPDVKKTLLDMAADIMDKTAPNPDATMEIAVRGKHAKNQVEFLVQVAPLMLPVRESGWPARRVRPTAWPEEHARAMRVMEQLLKNENPPAAVKATLLEWLAPVWGTYPQLQKPCEKLIGYPDYRVESKILS